MVACVRTVGEQGLSLSYRHKVVMQMIIKLNMCPQDARIHTH